MEMHQRFSEHCKTLVVLAAIAVFTFGSPWRAGAEQDESALVEPAITTEVAAGTLDNTSILAYALDLDEAQGAAGAEDRETPFRAGRKFTSQHQTDTSILGTA